MSPKSYFNTAGIIFLLVAAVHSARLLNRWEAEIGGWDVPMWISWLAVLAGLFMAYHGFRLGKK